MGTLLGPLVHPDLVAGCTGDRQVSTYNDPEMRSQSSYQPPPHSYSLSPGKTGTTNPSFLSQRGCGVEGRRKRLRCKYKT